MSVSSKTVQKKLILSSKTSDVKKSSFMKIKGYLIYTFRKTAIKITILMKTSRLYGHF